MNNSNNPKSRSANRVAPQNPRNQNNLKTKKRAPRRRKTTQNNNHVIKQVMKECSLHYLEAICDPFAFRIKGALPCIPDLLDIPSHKYNVTQRGVLSIGTSGFGFILISPLITNSTDRIATYSNLTFAGTSMNRLPGVGVDVVNATAFPYTSSPRRPTRTVACGVRVRYIGTELNRGGRIAPVMAAGPGDYLDIATFASISSRPDVETKPVNRAWHGTTFRPTDPDWYAYNDVDSGLAASAAYAQMAIALDGTPGNNFEFEITSFYETLSGPGLPITSQSSSHSDVLGLSMVRDFFGGLSTSEVGQGLWIKALTYLKTAGTAIAGQTAQVGMKLLM